MGAGRHRSTYSWRAKIGLIVPPTNTVNEAEWSRLMPQGVTFHTVRMAIHSDPDTGRDELVADIAARVRELAAARVDVVAYACTAGSMVHPAHDLPGEVEAETGVPVVTTAAAIVDALAHLRARRISIATPYHQALNDHEVHFLAENGVETARILGLGLGANGPVDYPRISETPLAEIEVHARRAFVPGTDALLVTCTDFPSLPLIPDLEASLGVPVLSSNTATLWAALRRAEIPDALAPAGRLFAEGAA